MDEFPEKSRFSERRDFLSRIGMFSFAASMFALFSGMGRFMKANIFYEPSTKYKIGRPEEFPSGSTTSLGERKLFVFSDESGIHVISAVCTHLGCIVHEVADGFVCPCHGSKFDTRGDILKAPAPKPLPWLEVSLSPDGFVVVDTNKEVPAGTKFKV